MKPNPDYVNAEWECGVVCEHGIFKWKGDRLYQQLCGKFMEITDPEKKKLIPGGRPQLPPNVDCKDENKVFKRDLKRYE